MKNITIIFLCLLLFACPKSIPTVGNYKDDIERFYPLQKGYSWSYLLTSVLENTSSLIKTEVEEVSGNEYKINSNGSVFYYIRTDEGILKKSANYYILKKGLLKGRDWEFKSSGFTGKITVVDFISKMRVRDNIFKNCIVTEEIIYGQNLLLRTYYAEGVGPVLIEQYSVKDSKLELNMKAEILGYSFAPIPSEKE
ncbi:MAG: hypothetical protein ACP5QK_04220 [Myxococcota bacterium]